MRTTSEAIAFSKTITNGPKYKGLCLVFVRDCYGIAARYPSAAQAWKNAQYKHATQNVNDIPAGRPVFFSIPGNPYGHVALYLGGGLFRTNYSGKSTIVTASLDHPVFYGMRMLGYTDDLNGVKLKTGGTSTAKPKPKPVTHTVVRGDTLSGIGVRYGVKWQNIANLNNLRSPYTIYPGQKLTIKK